MIRSLFFILSLMRMICVFIGSAKDILATLKNAEEHNALDKFNGKRVEV